jgi:16S rRNA (uracil1498-N3)-methyltransferase
VRVTRAHVDAPLAPGTRVVLPDNVATHLLRVLRLGVGDACVLFNGDGRDYDARIVAAGRRDAAVEITARRIVDNESPLRIVLLQGIARSEKMDWILQKATELGVVAFVPVLSERSTVRLSGERVGRRLEHWRQVVVAACEQSGRARVPEVSAPEALQAAVVALPDDVLRLLLDPAASAGTASLPAPGTAGCCLAIGPEGGWSRHDRALLMAAGFSALRLGPRVLRTETAGLAGIAALQARFGDLCS